MAVGDMVRQIAQRYMWDLAPRTVVLEGDRDARYLRCAARLHQQATGETLLDGTFNVTSCGSGQNGGIPNLKERFIVIRNIADSVDTHADGHRVFFFLALFDGDDPGKKAASSLRQQVPRFAIGRDIVVLHHVMPVIAAGQPNGIESAIKTANQDWRMLPCVIEDLVGDELFDLFCEHELDGVKVGSQTVTGRTHKKLTESQKADLCRFTEREAGLEDVERFIALLHALRAYVGVRRG